MIIDWLYTLSQEIKATGDQQEKQDNQASQDTRVWLAQPELEVWREKQAPRDHRAPEDFLLVRLHFLFFFTNHTGVYFPVSRTVS